MASKRGNFIRTGIRDLRAQEKKLVQAAALLTSTLKQHVYTKESEEFEYHAAVERLQVCMLLLGMKPSPGNTENLMPLTADDFQSQAPNLSWKALPWQSMGRLLYSTEFRPHSDFFSFALGGGVDKAK